MNLDFWLVARLAKELDLLLSGARIQDVGTSDGFLLSCYRRGEHLALQIAVNADVPLAAVTRSGQAAKESGTAGWVAGVAGLLRSATIDGVQAVPNDRVLYVDISSRSAFGLPSRSRLVAELQPRKANALVLRLNEEGTWVIVAAAKQFAPARATREVATGAAYHPPPRRRPRIDRAQFLIAATSSEGETTDALARLLTELDVDCTPLLAREAVFRARAHKERGQSARAVLDAWAALHHEVEDALQAGGPVHVVRRDEHLVACHLVELRHLHHVNNNSTDSLTTALVPTVNELCAQQIARRHAKGGTALQPLRKKLATMLSRCDQEQTTLEAARQKAQDATALREAGDAIYGHLAQIHRGDASLKTEDGVEVKLDPLLTPAANAATYFRRYKKARSGLAGIEARLRALQANREYWYQLEWELSRADALEPATRESVVNEITAAVGLRGSRTAKRRAPRRDEPITLPGGAVAYVGRSPKDNERLTFSVAGPNDYWFHARNMPGAHVIVKTGGAPLLPEQIERAATLAAVHSRASSAGHVDVDYTKRKHVRRQASGKPGLVWYTDFSTIRVVPEST